MARCVVLKAVVVVAAMGLPSLRCCLAVCERSDGTVDAVCELIAPHRPGRYRVFFALLSAASGERVDGCDELFADFFVGDEDGWRRNLLRHRRSLGAAWARSWIGLPPPGSTLVIAFAGADATIAGRVTGGVPSHEFVKALKRAGVGRSETKQGVQKIF